MPRAQINIRGDPVPPEGDICQCLESEVTRELIYCHFIAQVSGV